MNTTKSAKTPDRRQGALEPAQPVLERVSSTSRNGTAERILQRLDWQVIRRLDGLLQGDYRSLFYGYGVDFADLREYQPEDDIRYIDWNVTARMDTPYVRQYSEDREVTAWFLVDLSPSMDFGTTEVDKRTMLIDLVAVLSRILTRHGNRVGAILYSGQDGKAVESRRKDHRLERLIPARGGRNQVLRIINDLLHQPRLPKSAFTDLKAMLESGLNTIKQRSVVFVISDFISVPGWERTLGLLNQRHEVLAVRLSDPREAELPDVGFVWMEDAETGEQVFIDTHDPKFRASFSEATRQREAALLSAFRHAGVEPWLLSTGEDLVGAVIRFASIRKQFHRGRGTAVRKPSAASAVQPAVTKVVKP
jgi:uncharacterized protein (DUF58 family)